jgi:hypothetical protein
MRIGTYAAAARVQKSPRRLGATADEMALSTEAETCARACVRVRV